MKDDLYSLLYKILDIIAYPEDKEYFVQQFYRSNYLEAMLHIISRLPKETQEKIKAFNTDPEKIKAYISADEYTEELKKVTEASLTDFLTSISVDLDTSQKEKIATLFSA